MNENISTYNKKTINNVIFCCKIYLNKTFLKQCTKPKYQMTY